MKQNSSIMFHGRSKGLARRCLRHWESTIFAVVCCILVTLLATSAHAAESLAEFDPTKGFKPAQSDLTAVFLQIAGSLEYYGSPEPYLRHMQAEHARIEAKYRQQLGEKPKSFCPAYMDATYFDRLASNWKHMASQLGLESLAKNTGRQLRSAIQGSTGSGTSLADLLKSHTQAVGDAMASSKSVPIPGFPALQADMVQCLKLDGSPVQVSELSPEQQAAIVPTQVARAAFLKLFAAIDSGLPPADAQKVEAVIVGIITDVGYMAQSEIEAARVEASLDYQHSLEGPYSIEQETALSAAERNTFSGFMKKPRFTKADFPALDKFYAGPYDRLSERGKDEMSKRIDAGMYHATR